MKSTKAPRENVSNKAPTGITGFDEITGGGLPRGLTTLVIGGPGSGKTIFALQYLVHGAQDFKEPGIFVAFEETSKRIVANAKSFGWKLAELQRKKLFLWMPSHTRRQFSREISISAECWRRWKHKLRKWVRGASCSTR